MDLIKTEAKYSSAKISPRRHQNMALPKSSQDGGGIKQCQIYAKAEARRGQNRSGSETEAEA